MGSSLRDAVTGKIGFLKELLLRYSTFDGKTTVSRSVGPAILGLLVSAVGLLLTVIEFGITSSGLIAISVLGISVLVLVIRHYTLDAARRTVDPEFYHWKGLSKVVVCYTLVGIFAVAVLHFVGVILLEGIGLPEESVRASLWNIGVAFFDLALPEALLGGALIFLVAGIIAFKNADALSEFPAQSSVMERFKAISDTNLDRVDNEIEDIGHVPRRETNRILEGLLAEDELDNFIVKGKGGVGKSGVLKKVCNECDHRILFIDTSTAPAISSHDDLADELELDASLTRCIRHAGVTDPLVVIFDQLDDVNRQAGETYKELILDIAQIEGVSTIFACRSYELENYDEFVALKDSPHFGSPVTISTLGETKVREFLEGLDVTSPSPDLVELCQEIEYLDVVARLRDDGADLDHVTDEVQVWDAYRQLIAEDHPSEDQYRGRRVVNRAVEYAVAATEEDSVFTVTENDWIDDQLISNGVIQRVSRAAGERRFRFRHQQFQLYLYAWKKVSDTEHTADEAPFRQAVEELDDRINNDVVKWMFAVYTGREDELPEGTAAFLAGILDADSGFQFYWAAKISDVLKKWDAAEDEEVAHTVLDCLEEREDLYRHFFNEEADPSWAEALADTNRFQDPPGHLLGYLLDIASVHPEIVGAILHNELNDVDRRGRATMVSIIQELPIEYGAEFADLVETGLTDPEPTIDLYYSRAAEFAESLIHEEYFDKGLVLVERLLTVRLHGSVEEGRSESMSSYYLKSLFEDGTLQQLIRARPQDTVDLFESQIQEATQVRAEERDRDVDEIVLFHLRSVSYYELADSERHQPFELFIGFLRTTLDIWCEQVSADDRRQKIEEYLEGSVVFRAFGLYLLREYSGRYPELVAEELVREDNYRDFRLRKDFNLLLKHGFAALAEDFQQAVIAVITRVPVQSSLEEAAQQKQDQFKEMTVDEIVEQESARWIRDQLWMIRDHLPEEAERQLSDLVEQFDDEPEDPETDVARGGIVSFESPEPRPNLEDLPPEELIEFCIEEPFEEEEWYGTGSTTEVGRRGTAELVADIILDNPDRYASAVPGLRDAPADYSVQLLGYLRDQMEDDPALIANEVFREHLWMLTENIVSNPDEWPSHVRKRVGWVFRDGLGSEDLYEYFLADDDRVRELIFVLLDDPDPDIERDRPPEDYAGYNDPSHTALNTVRPVALDALIIYAFRRWAGEEAGLDSVVAEQLAEMLDDISLGVHSVFGREFTQLWAADTMWVREHLSEIFPRSQSRRDIEKFMAAWDSYVAFNKVYPDIFRELREYYFHAIDLMAEGEHTETVNADQRMAGHLLFNYLYEYDLEKWSDSLLAYLYDRSDPELARHVAWHLWKHGNNLDEDEAYEKWEKTRFLWNQRIEQVGDDAAYSDEISWFVEWLEHVEDRVFLDEVHALLRESAMHITDNWRAWEATEAYLANQSEQYPELAITLFYDLVEEFEQLPRHGFTEEVAAILQPGFHAFDRDSEIYQDAFEIAQRYASEGHDEAEQFIDAHR